MKVSRRKKTKVVYKNGGKTGDPKKDLVQDPDGLPLYLETLPDGTKRITPTPSLSNYYVKLSDKVGRGYYSGIPLLLDAAEVVADDPNKDPLGAIDEVVEKTGAGVLGDYARIPESERKAANQRIKDALNKFAKTAAATTVGPVSDIYSAPQRYLVNSILSGLTGKKANYNPLASTKSMLQEAGYSDDSGEGFQTPSEALGIENPIGAFAVDAATDPSTLLGLNTIPALRRAFLRKAGRFVDDIPANQLYRGLGKEGADDALKSGVLRPRPSAAEQKAGSFLMEKIFKNLYASPDPMVAKRYGGGYLVSIPKDVAKFKKTYKGKDWSMRTADEIPTDKVKILKEYLYRDFLGRPKVGYRVLNK